MEYSSRVLKSGDTGEDVQELQIRLSGFSGGHWDGEFGPGTELQVKQFQQDYMKIEPTGIANADTFGAINAFSKKYPIDFKTLRCPCGECSGFGNGVNKGVYRDGKPQIEQYHLYEYPGIHRAILWASRAIFFYHTDREFEFSSGYRCSIRNKQQGRTTTNHMGKALDIDDILEPGEDKQDDLSICNDMRARTVEKSKAQIGWNDPNKKSFEPADIAPTWLHYDVRSYDPKYLDDKFFCKDIDSLNGSGMVLLNKRVEEAPEPTKESAKEPVAEVAPKPKSFLEILIDLILALFSWRKK